MLGSIENVGIAPATPTLVKLGLSKVQRLLIVSEVMDYRPEDIQLCTQCNKLQKANVMMVETVKTRASRTVRNEGGTDANRIEQLKASKETNHGLICILHLYEADSHHMAGVCFV